jgi:hypothetical protein
VQQSPASASGVPLPEPGRSQPSAQLADLAGGGGSGPSPSWTQKSCSSPAFGAQGGSVPTIHGRAWRRCPSQACWPRRFAAVGLGHPCRFSLELQAREPPWEEVWKIVHPSTARGPRSPPLRSALHIARFGRGRPVLLRRSDSSIQPHYHQKV